MVVLYGNVIATLKTAIYLDCDKAITVKNFDDNNLDGLLKLL